jgi:hypothetical protein
MTVFLGAVDLWLFYDAVSISRLYSEDVEQQVVVYRGTAPASVQRD